MFYLNILVLFKYKSFLYVKVFQNVKVLFSNHSSMPLKANKVKHSLQTIYLQLPFMSLLVSIKYHLA